MPLVALLDGVRVEAPLLALGRWQTIVRVGDRLTCPECGRRMVGRQGATRIAHFAHQGPRGDCGWGVGESAEHLRLKWSVAEAVRSNSGWDAEVEAKSGNWRADVLATSSSGRRIAFEIQLARQTLEDAVERTLRYEADGVEVVWLVDRRVGWMTRVPTLVVSRDRVGDADEVIEGHWRSDASHWAPADARPLASIVPAILDRRMHWGYLGGLCWTDLPDGGHSYGYGWTTMRHRDAVQRAKDARAAADAADRATRKRVDAAHALAIRSARKRAHARHQEMWDRVTGHLDRRGSCWQSPPAGPKVEGAGGGHQLSAGRLLIICEPDPNKLYWPPLLRWPGKVLVVVHPSTRNHVVLNTDLYGPGLVMTIDEFEASPDALVR